MFVPRKTDLPSHDSMVTCLVAGGAGFIGSHLCERLLDQNCYVYCVDNFSTGRKGNLAKLREKNNFRFIEHNLSETQPLVFERKVDYIFHVAGAEAYMNGLNVDYGTLLVNSYGTKTLLQIAVENQAKFLLVSSEKVYDQVHAGADLKEYFGVDRSHQGESLFLEAKRFSEALTVEYFKEKEVDARIVRLAYLYGPHMNLEAGNLLAKLFKAAVARGSLKVPNDGMAPIYPTYIADAVYGLIKAMFSQSSAGKIYGLVNTQPVTILRFVYKLQELIGKNLTIEFFEDASYLQTSTIPPEVLKSQEALGWYPRQSLESGIITTLDWLKNTVIVNEAQTESRVSNTDQNTLKGAMLTTEKERGQRFVVEEVSENLEATQTICCSQVTQVETISSPQISEKTKPVPSPSADSPPPLTIQPNVSKTRVFDEIKRIFLRVGDKKPYTGPQPVIKRSRTPYWFIAIVLLFVVLGLVLPMPFTVMMSNKGLSEIAHTKDSITAGNWKQARKHIQTVKDIDSFCEKVTPIVYFEQAVFKIRLPRYVQEYKAVNKKMIAALENIVTAGANMNDLYEIALNRQDNDPEVVLQTVTTALQQANENLAFLEAELAQHESSDSLRAEIKNWRQQVRSNMMLVPIISDTLAFNTKRTLLVLLQDSQELRPTGGFIEGLAIVTAENGKVLDVQFLDVYEVDKLLKGVVAPPEDIKRFLGEENWWLRDANTAPDFPTSAARAAWFLQKEKGVTVDGVVAVNLLFFKDLLSVVGEVSLSEYSDSVANLTVLEKAQQHAEVNFFETATDNKSGYLVSLAKAVYEKIKNASSSQLGALSTAVHTGFEERNILMWLPDTPASAMLAQNGWDGALRTTPTQLVEFGQVDVRDYTGYFEANYGVNKANHFIQRKIDQQVSILPEGRVDVVSSLTIMNTSTSETWPAGRYKDYVRLYIPQTAQFTQVLSGADAAVGLTPFSDEEIIKGSENEKNFIGVYVEVPPQEQRILKLHYTLGDSFPITQPKATYALYTQKQSGTANTPLSVTIKFPETLKPIKLSKNAHTEPGRLLFNETLDTDQVVAVSFSR